MRNLAVLTFIIVASTTPAVAQQDPYDGQGDSSNKPDMWVVPTEAQNGNAGTVTVPGDNQPVQQNGNRLNFDTTPSSDSEIVIIEE